MFDINTSFQLSPGNIVSKPNNIYFVTLFDYAHLFYGPVFSGEQGVPLLTGYESRDRDTAFKLNEVCYRRLGDDFMVSGMLDYSV